MSMTKKDARLYAQDVADEIAGLFDDDGVFSDEERETEDSLMDACYLVEENRRQYAGLQYENITRDEVWDAFDDEFASAMSAHVENYFRRRAHDRD